jgi:hypothetical protein
MAISSQRGAAVMLSSCQTRRCAIQCLVHFLLLLYYLLLPPYKIAVRTVDGSIQTGQYHTTSCSHPRSGLQRQQFMLLFASLHPRHRPRLSPPNASHPNRNRACVASAALQMWPKCAALFSVVCALPKLRPAGWRWWCVLLAAWAWWCSPSLCSSNAYLSAGARQATHPIPSPR